tara:strand:- start:546 stop:1916 length:1371 start_codon:yes stop_codon:yes gene_type:complete
MDEEELEQPSKKITLSNFFESIVSVDRVAKTALKLSQENLSSIQAAESLFSGLEESIKLIEEDIESITNYFIVQQNERSKIIEFREQEASKQEDLQQKKIDDKQKGLEDVPPFGGKGKNLLQSLSRGVAGIVGEARDPLLTAGLAFGLNFVSKLTGFSEGGDPPINKPAIVGEGGPEIFVPKTSGTIIPNDKKINVQALLNTISTAEGTGKGGYGTIYGGTDDNPITVPELAQGKMTINQVLNMMRTGKIMRDGKMVDVGYGKENNVGATGRYQFIPAALEEEVEHMMKKDKDFSYDTFFTPDVQNKLMLQRLKEKRNIDFDKLEKEGLTRGAIDKLSEEFESFPNLLPGPRKNDLGPVEGRTDQSFYDIKGDQAPVRSEQFIKSVFESEVDKLTPPDEDLSSITLPPIGDVGGNEIVSSTAPPLGSPTVKTDDISGTESVIAFIDVISNPFLSVV